MTGWIVVLIAAAFGALLLAGIRAAARHLHPPTEEQDQDMTIDRARFVAQFTSRPAPPPLSAFAIAGLVLSLCGVSPLGALLSAFALQDVRDGRRTGRWIAHIGLIVGLLGCIVWAYLVVQAVNPMMLR